MSCYQVSFEKDRKGLLPFKVTLKESALKTVQTPFGLAIELDGCPTTSEVGGPGLPSFTIAVALPPRINITNVRAQSRVTTQPVSGPVHVAPVQHPRLAVNQPPGSRRSAHFLPGLILFLLLYHPIRACMTGR